MAISLIVQAVSPHLFVRPERVQAFNASPYVRAFVLLVIPNVIFCVALLHLVASWSRSTLATFVASIAIYAGYFVTAMMVDSPLMAGTRPPTPELLARVALLDPFGLSAFFEQTRYWTPLEQNTRAVVLGGHMLWNRLLVLGMGVLCLAPLPWLDGRRRTKFTVKQQRAGNLIPTRDDDTQAATHVPAPVASVTPAMPSLATHWYATLPRCDSRHACSLRSWPLRALLVLWVAMIAIEAQGQWPAASMELACSASSAVLADAVPIGLWLIGTLCAMYFAAEVVSRERILHFDGIGDATPVANSAMLLGKLVALMIIPVLLSVAGYGTAMAVHATAGGLPIDLRVYGAHAITSLVPLWITTMLAVALQVLSGNRWLGLFAGFAIAFITEAVTTSDSNTCCCASVRRPACSGSDLDGFGSRLPSWIAFSFTWALGAIVLLGVAAALWPRGQALPFMARWRRMPALFAQGLSRKGLVALASVTTLFVATYALMVHETVTKAQWESRGDVLAWRADYERTYRRLQGKPQAQIADVQLDVSLEPSRRRATVHGTLLLENRTSSPIDTVWIQPSRDVEDVTMKSPEAKQIVRDEKFGVHTVVLTAPLAPGAQATLDYSLVIDRGGLRADGFDEDVAENGSFIGGQVLIPAMGYQGRYEIANELERAKLGLAEPRPCWSAIRWWTPSPHEREGKGTIPSWFTSHTTITHECGSNRARSQVSWCGNGRAPGGDTSNTGSTNLQRRTSPSVQRATPWSEASIAT
jgi:hypothetical protein